MDWYYCAMGKPCPNSRSVSLTHPRPRVSPTTMPPLTSEARTEWDEGLESGDHDDFLGTVEEDSDAFVSYATSWTQTPPITTMRPSAPPTTRATRTYTPPPASAHRPAWSAVSSPPYHPVPPHPPRTEPPYRRPSCLPSRTRRCRWPRRTCQDWYEVWPICRRVYASARQSGSFFQIRGHLVQ